jgi:pyruvate/2-oxoglutarate dehydrogenase complex dihydrolipoamide acyltransferase (E2) component
LLWWFRWPAHPWNSYSSSIDFTHALAYLEGLRKSCPERVTVQHLLVAAVARLLWEFPEANARAVGTRLELLDSVGVLIPIVMKDETSGQQKDLSVLLLERVERMTLRGIAAKMNHAVPREREGQKQHPAIRAFTWVAERLPDPVLHGGLSLAERLGTQRHVARLIHHLVPASTGITNVGAAMTRDATGPLLNMRGAHAGMPDRLLHVGTSWVVFGVQDEVVAVDGRPEVRPMLPIVLVCDHRVVDGVPAGHLLKRFAELLHAPEIIFGPMAEYPLDE